MYAPKGTTERPGDPVGDPTVALRGSHYLGPGPPVRSHVEYRVVPYQAASDDPARFAGVRVLGVDEHVWHHHDRRRRGPRAHRHRGPDSREGSFHGPLEWTGCREGLAPCTRTGPSAEKTSVRGCESRRSIPFQGLQECHCLACSKDATSVRGACHIVTLAGDAPGEVRRRVQQDTTGHRGCKGDPLYQIRLLLRASRDRLMKRQQERLREAFTADEAHN